MASLTPLSNHLSSLSRMCTLLSSRVSLFLENVGALLSLSLGEVLFYVMLCACEAVVWSLLYSGPHTLRCTAYMTTLSFYLGVMSFGWTSLCLRMFLGFEMDWNVMFREDPSKFLWDSTYGITVCLHLFFLASLPVLFGPIVCSLSLNRYTLRPVM